MGLNDSLWNWGRRQSPQVTTSTEAWDALTAPYTQDQVANFDGQKNFNAGLERLADGGEILKSATLWLDSRYSVVGEQVAVNQGSGGSALNATYGSTAGVDTNDPLFLPHTGENYLYVPAAGGNGCYTVSSPPLDLTGDLEIVCRYSKTSWGTYDAFLIKGAHYALRSDVSGLGYPQFVFTNGDGLQFAGSGAVLPLSGWVKVTFDADNGSGGNTTTFYTAPDQVSEPTAWTLHGAPSVGTGTSPLTTGIANLETGSGFSEGFDGKLLRTILRNGIGGTAVFEIDFTTAITSSAATSFTATTGQTVAVGRSTTGRKMALVTRPIWLFGTDDYLEIPDNALLDFDTTDSFTIVVVARVFSTDAGDRYLSKFDGVTGYLVSRDNTNLYAEFIAPNQTVGITKALGSLETITVVRNVGTDKFSLNANNGIPSEPTDLTTSTYVNSEPFRIGTGTGQYLNGELAAIAVFRRALTTAEIAAINAFYGTA
jgi:hypothetical protein